jgi:anti-anti-sigma factor
MGPASNQVAHAAVEADGGRPVLVCQGELDIANVDQIRDAALELLPVVPPSGLVIDLAQVTFADSRAIAALLSVRKMLHGRPVHLRGVNPRLQASLEMLSVDSLFTLEPAPGPVATALGAALDAATPLGGSTPIVAERSA